MFDCNSPFQCNQRIENWVKYNENPHTHPQLMRSLQCFNGPESVGGWHDVIRLALLALLWRWILCLSICLLKLCRRLAHKWLRIQTLRALTQRMCTHGAHAHQIYFHRRADRSNCIAWRPANTTMYSTECATCNGQVATAVTLLMDRTEPPHRVCAIYQVCKRFP